MLGAFLSLAASILDGCDGEIARLKYQESALGCWIETFGDYSYYVAIFVGLTIGAVAPDPRRGVLLDRRAGARRHAAVVRAPDLPAQPHHRRTPGAAARDRDGALQGRADLLVAPRSGASRSPPRAPRCPTASSPSRSSIGLPGIVVLAAIGANVYWISLVVKLRALMGEEDAVAA